MFTDFANNSSILSAVRIELEWQEMRNEVLPVAGLLPRDVCGCTSCRRGYGLCKWESVTRADLCDCDSCRYGFGVCENDAMLENISAIGRVYRELAASLVIELCEAMMPSPDVIDESLDSWLTLNK